MSPDWIIGALALVTIGSVLALAALHFGVYLKDPKNVDAFARVAKDRESATTRVSAEGTNGRSLRQRLDQAPTVNDRLSARSESPSPLSVLLDTRWSDISAALKSRS